MKYISFYLLLAVFFGIPQENTRENAIQWNTDYETTLKKAKKENKNVLVYFTGSDWCGPCKSLKKDLFDTDEFKEIAENYELLYIDIPRKKGILSTEQLQHNMDLMVMLNKRGVFPNLKVLNTAGKEIGALSGYNRDGSTQKHLNFLKKYID